MESYLKKGWPKFLPKYQRFPPPYHWLIRPSFSLGTTIKSTIYTEKRTHPPKQPKLTKPPKPENKEARHE